MDKEVEKIQKQFPSISEKRCLELLEILGDADDVIDELKKRVKIDYEEIIYEDLEDEINLSENVKYIKYDKATYNENEKIGSSIDNNEAISYFNDILNGKITINRDTTKHIFINDEKSLSIFTIVLIIGIIFLFINSTIGIILIGVYFVYVLFLVLSGKEKMVFNECIPIINEIADNSINKYYELLKKYNIKEKKVNGALIERTNFDIFEEENCLQYYVDESGITLYALPLYKLTINVGLDKYIIPIFNEEKAEKIIHFKAKDIDGFTYYGSELIETDISGGGYDLGGALVGGFLFGGVGAIIGSQEEIKTKNKKLDLREVQINFKGKKTIVLKSFDIYKDLMAYFSDKEINNKEK